MDSCDEVNKKAPSGAQTGAGKDGDYLVERSRHAEQKWGV